MKYKNFKKKKILIYTDSRGYNVIGKFGKIPFDSYIFQLCFKYNVDYFICPEKYTTIVDFLNYINEIDTNKYDFIIMHCGVVDFSPRPLTNISNVKESKKGNKTFDQLFNLNQEYYDNPFETEYNNEKTITLYSTKYLESHIIPHLKKIKNLIWINSNKFVFGWEGNYTKGRPKNIMQTVNDFDSVMSYHIKNFIDLKSWDDNTIKDLTIDNIHFTKEGFYEIYQLIKKEIEK
ncbi:MAG: hypothetical protein HYU67_13540 [Flavobacteriia bacterium]|nr:hypothetical protein [Flavobacteriia bacterium]